MIPNLTDSDEDTMADSASKHLYVGVSRIPGDAEGGGSGEPPVSDLEEGCAAQPERVKECTDMWEKLKGREKMDRGREGGRKEKETTTHKENGYNCLPTVHVIEVADGNVSSSQTQNRMTKVRVFEDKISLTECLIHSDTQFRSIYGAMLIQAAAFMIYVVVHETWIAGSSYSRIGQLLTLEGGTLTLVHFVCLELFLLLSSITVYPVFMSWVWCHKQAPSLLVGLFYVVLCACYVTFTSVVMFWAVLSLPLTHFTALISGLEQIRLLMKCYSFIRENAYKVLYPWHKDDNTGPAVWYAGQMQPQIGSFSAYIYFLFCPTLLYRDKYPQVNGPINWKNAAAYFVHFLFTLWSMIVLFKYFLFPPSFKNVSLVQCYISALLFAFLILVILHMCFFHALTNLISELTRFADRQFYNDWWTSTSFPSYYRKWNTIVYDWIYSYLFLDMCTVFHSNLPAIMSTLFLSAFMHEYLLAIFLGFASPVLLIEFAGLGVMVYFMRCSTSRHVSNLVVLGSLSFGMANLLFYYTAEVAARIYCPRPLTVRTFFVPRMIECYMEQNSP